MKKIALTLVLVLGFLPGCRLGGACLNAAQCARYPVSDDGSSTGSGDCSSAVFKGTWKEDDDSGSDSLTVDEDCKVTGSACSFTGYFTSIVNPSATTGSMNLEINSVTDTTTSPCSEVIAATYACTYTRALSDSKEQFVLSCKESTDSYIRTFYAR